jgi:glycosyltransferase involved in cell wall biosynthesis
LAASCARLHESPLAPRSLISMISILIPTKNEEEGLPECLASVAWSDDIHIYDSYSTDRTADIALASGAHVTRRPDQDRAVAFGGNEAEHRNWALTHIHFKYPWVLHLDADERVTPLLAANLRAAALDRSECAAYRVQRRDFFLGRWLKHVQASPYYIRLFRPARIHYERLINPVARVDGAVGEVAGFLDHYPFSKGISHWVARHNSYSTFEAQQIVANRRAHSEWSIVKALTAKDFHERRYHQKELFYRLPARPLMKFTLLYFAKLGLLDGRAGFTYAALQAIYEYLIVLKTRELEVAAAKAAERGDR